MTNPIEYLNEPRLRNSRPGLSRISVLMDKLGRPDRDLKFVHVAGTNGKGSICTYISEILIRAGYKVGTFTSPYIWNFEERIRVNGKVITLEDLAKRTQEVADICEDKSIFDDDDHPTEFEMMTAVGLLHFARQNCDVVVLEVGMGGRYDSTNVIDAASVLCSVIASISIDHTNFLGSDLGQIASEKAGIIKPDTDVVCWDQPTIAMKIVNKEAERSRAKITIPKFISIVDDRIDLSRIPIVRSFSYDYFEGLQTQMIAKYQPKNAAMAIEVVKILREKLPQGEKLISDDIIKKGIAKSYWPVRFEIVQNSPYVVIDGGHNLDGVEALIQSLNDVFPNKKIIFIFGVLADKEYKKMIDKIAPLATQVFTITPDNPRALSAEKLAADINAAGIDVMSCTSYKKAVYQAKNIASTDDVICCFGSLYSAAKLHDLF